MYTKNEGSNNETDVYPLTSYQGDIWIEQMIYSDKPLYNIGGYIEVMGKIKPGIFHKSVDCLLRENDALRTVFFEKDGQPFQSFLPQTEYSGVFYDFSNEANPAEYSKTWMDCEMVKPFNIYGDILCKICLIKAEEDLFYIFYKCHHLITDGWGFSVICERFKKIYTAMSQDKENVPESIYSYSEFILEEQKYSNEKNRLFWKERLKELPEPLLMRRTDGHSDSFTKSSRESIALERRLYNGIIDFCNSNGCSIFHFFLGILAVYFSRIYSRDSIVIGVSILNRKNAKFKSIVGHFANVIPLIISVYKGQGFIDLMQKIRDDLKECYRHQRLSCGQILNEIEDSIVKKTDIIEIMLSYEKHKHDVTFGEFTANAVALTNYNKKNPLSLFIREFDEERDVIVNFDYQIEVFNDAFPIKNVVGNLKNLLLEVLADCSKDVIELNYLSWDEKFKIQYEINDTKADYPRDKTIHELFEEQAGKTSGNIAVVYEEKELSYRELNTKANQLAGVLRDKGVKPDTIVAIMSERSLEMIIGLL